jgi:hypothetical protein
MGNIERCKCGHKKEIAFSGVSIGRWLSSEFRGSPLPNEAEPKIIAIPAPAGLILFISGSMNV